MTPTPQTPDPDEVVEALAWLASLPWDEDAEGESDATGIERLK